MELENNSRMSNPVFVMGIAVDQLLNEVSIYSDMKIDDRDEGLLLIQTAREERSRIGFENIDLNTRELARISDIAVMAGALGRLNFFRNGFQVRNLAEVVWDSTISPSSITGFVRHPDKVFNRVTNLTPEILTNLVFLWGECEMSFTGNALYRDHMTKEQIKKADARARGSVPSLRLLWQASTDMGLDLNMPLTIDDADELISTYRLHSRPIARTTSRIYSDPLHEIIDTEVSLEVMSDLACEADYRTSQEIGWLAIEPLQDHLDAINVYGRDCLEDDPDLNEGLANRPYNIWSDFN